ncbi:hypothetical protein MMC19_006887 [Ptychographa xylographoides]|nr:hypothetical protein [Ptychographa xylographoides]
MPFILHTPESLIPRSDSKNPATTCRGITSSGRPCRRSLATSPRASTSSSPHPAHGSSIPLHRGHNSNGAAIALLCWQHKEQGQNLVTGTIDHKAKVVELRERTSIDTLVARLGVLDCQDGGRGGNKQRPGYNAKPVAKGTLPAQLQKIPGPLMSVPKDVSAVDQFYRSTLRPHHHRRHERHAQSTFVLSLFCCTGPPDSDHTPPPRVNRIETGRLAPETVQTSSQSFFQPQQKIQDTSIKRPPLLSPQSHPSQTSTLLCLIPTSLPPPTTSLLLTELAKPLPRTSEPGYIYMFWLTPFTTPPPSTETASSLLSLAPSSAKSRTTARRRGSDLTNTLNSMHSAAAGGSTIMLKIGRASNVQRRLNEWTKQCNYNLSLIRYYPYQPSSPPPPSPSPSPCPTPSAPPSRQRTSPSFPSFGTPALDTSTPRKVPHVQRVERLIHLELAERRVRKGCAGCGKEHREWFEVDASRDGVRRVDEVVKRWVRWGESVDGG